MLSVCAIKIQWISFRVITIIGFFIIIFVVSLISRVNWWQFLFYFFRKYHINEKNAIFLIEFFQGKTDYFLCIEGYILHNVFGQSFDNSHNPKKCYKYSYSIVMNGRTFLIFKIRKLIPPIFLSIGWNIQKIRKISKHQKLLLHLFGAYKWIKHKDEFKFLLVFIY